MRGHDARLAQAIDQQPDDLVPCEPLDAHADIRLPEEIAERRAPRRFRQAHEHRAEAHARHLFRQRPREMGSGDAEVRRSDQKQVLRSRTRVDLPDDVGDAPDVDRRPQDETVRQQGVQAALRLLRRGIGHRFDSQHRDRQVPVPGEGLGQSNHAQGVHTAGSRRHDLPDVLPRSLPQDVGGRLDPLGGGQQDLRPGGNIRPVGHQAAQRRVTRRRVPVRRAVDGFCAARQHLGRKTSLIREFDDFGLMHARNGGGQTLQVAHRLGGLGTAEQPSRRLKHDGGQASRPPRRRRPSDASRA